MTEWLIFCMAVFCLVPRKCIFPSSAVFYDFSAATLTYVKRLKGQERELAFRQFLSLTKKDLKFFLLWLKWGAFGIFGEHDKCTM
jgi:hypothetical protein